jgi:hypothetical protein
VNEADRALVYPCFCIFRIKGVGLEDHFTLIGLEEYTKVQYQLFDEQGRAISDRINLTQGGSVNVQNLVSGSYYIRVYIDNNYALKKFIKQ